MVPLAGLILRDSGLSAGIKSSEPPHPVSCQVLKTTGPNPGHSTKCKRPREVPQAHRCPLVQLAPEF